MQLGLWYVTVSLFYEGETRTVTLKSPFQKYFPTKLRVYSFPMCHMGMKLCIGVYLNWSQQGKIVFPLETAYYRFFPCPLVLNYTTHAVVNNQQVYSNLVENVHLFYIR